MEFLSRILNMESLQIFWLIRQNEMLACRIHDILQDALEADQPALTIEGPVWIRCIPRTSWYILIQWL